MAFQVEMKAAYFAYKLVNIEIFFPKEWWYFYSIMPITSIKWSESLLPCCWKAVADFNSFSANCLSSYFVKFGSAYISLYSTNILDYNPKKLPLVVAKSQEHCQRSTLDDGKLCWHIHGYENVNVFLFVPNKKGSITVLAL